MKMTKKRARCIATLWYGIAGLIAIAIVSVNQGMSFLFAAPFGGISGAFIGCIYGYRVFFLEEKKHPLWHVLWIAIVGSVYAVSLVVAFFLLLAFLANLASITSMFPSMLLVILYAFLVGFVLAGWAAIVVAIPASYLLYYFRERFYQNKT